ncbi:water stress/hypersensitive response domain-containing protein [Pseudoxanthomonas broegbernensis]|uniref:Water stress/hypersensitive response domain-containing protein n=1 Tax=Pseudoxanthomonas broegbernensis TaxID=83619 RepID=A0A7V8GL36_9GAMM|nr:LEA type 2 family protein [Pseudoxanthomonas broegbernensis]KAF1685547.1 water stress/hypersensitive response domain-containing protein [Pseudoxanthomonas broegbernensis]MBB6065917.1 LEA14-like dessication related protein [Pseudoxanthomonas broegbernensis]
MRPAPVFQRLALLLLAALAGCAGLPHRDPLRVDVAGVESLPGEGMELRLAVKLRVQNPNAVAVDYDGAALELELNGRTLATGVSGAAGTVPRYGEAIVTIPVTVSMLGVARQIAAFGSGKEPRRLDYVVRGKLEGGLFGTRRFSGRGRLDIPSEQTAP